MLSNDWEKEFDEKFTNEVVFREVKGLKPIVKKRFLNHIVSDNGDDLKDFIRKTLAQEIARREKEIWEKLTDYNDRGIVSYWEEMKYAKCENCGLIINGKKAKEMQFGHIGCPKPNGYYIRQDLTVEDLKKYLLESRKI
jgi:hypothetical protein